MINIGRVCIKLAGRDAGKECAVIKSLDENFVIVDGNTRRKKTNIRHLEPINKTIEIKEDASTQEVLKALEGVGIETSNKK